MKLLVAFAAFIVTCCLFSSEYADIQTTQIYKSTNLQTIPFPNYPYLSCDDDTITVYIKLEQFVSSNDSCDYQWDDWNVCGYGYPAVISIWDSCGLLGGAGNQSYHLQMWSDDVVEVYIKKGWCLNYEIPWQACNYCPFVTESAVLDTVGWPVLLAIYKDLACTVQVWPSGSKLVLWPTKHSTQDSVNLQLYPGYASGEKIITNLCP